MSGHNAAREQSRKSGRYDELKAILEERRREIMSEVQGRMRDVRAEGGGELGPGRARRGGELRARHPGRDRIRAHPDEGRDAEPHRRGAPAARRGHLRQLLRVRRRNQREAAARAAVRGPLQELRGGARGQAAARAPDGAAPRARPRCSSTCRADAEPCKSGKLRSDHRATPTPERPSADSTSSPNGRSRFPPSFPSCRCAIRFCSPIPSCRSRLRGRPPSAWSRTPIWRGG